MDGEAEGYNPYSGNSSMATGGGLDVAGATIGFLGSLEQLRQSKINTDLQIGLATISEKGAQFQLGKLPELRELAFGGIERDQELATASFETGREALQADIALQKIQRGKQLVQEAIGTGNIRLARAEATRTARLESEQFRLINAAQGASAFARARTQMSINRFATLEQQTQALEKEKLFNRGAFTEEQKKLFGAAKLLETKFDLTMDSFDDLKKKTGIQFDIQKQELQGRYEAAKLQREANEKIRSGGPGKYAKYAPGAGAVGKKLGLW